MLTKGLERLAASIPWTSGQVVNEGASDGNTGVFKIAPFEKLPGLIMKDLRPDPSHAELTMDNLIRKHFPVSMLDEGVLAPRNAIPSADEPDSRPVFLVQANIIHGGLILTLNGQHQAMDMTGQAEVIRLLSKACCNEPFTKEELSTGNLDHLSLIPLLEGDSWRTDTNLAFQMVDPKSGGGYQQTLAPPNSTWSSFAFSADSLAELKALAMKDVDPPTYISTDDALSAFLWQSIVRARVPRLDPEAKSTLARAVDVRRALDLSPAYPRLMQNMTSFTTHRPERGRQAPRHGRGAAAVAAGARGAGGAHPGAGDVPRPHAGQARHLVRDDDRPVDEPAAQLVGQVRLLRAGLRPRAGHARRGAATALRPVRELGVPHAQGAERRDRGGHLLEG